MVISSRQRATVSPDVLFRMIGDEAVLLNLKTEQYLGLDPVGARMWDALKDAPSIQAAYDVLLSEFDVAPDQLREDLDEFLGSLVKEQLVQISDV